MARLWFSPTKGQQSSRKGLCLRPMSPRLPPAIPVRLRMRLQKEHRQRRRRQQFRTQRRSRSFPRLRLQLRPLPIKPLIPLPTRPLIRLPIKRRPTQLIKRLRKAHWRQRQPPQIRTHQSSRMADFLKLWLRQQPRQPRQRPIAQAQTQLRARPQKAHLQRSQSLVTAPTKMSL